eukprot:11175840-Lingulodinium_polyedra.AAC.1
MRSSHCSSRANLQALGLTQESTVAREVRVIDQLPVLGPQEGPQEVQGPVRDLGKAVRDVHAAVTPTKQRPGRQEGLFER